MFEHSLIGLEARPKSRRGWFSLPVAIVLHLVAFASFTFASYWDVAEVPDPPTMDVFYVTMAPPPPPPSLGTGKPPEEKAVEKKAVVEEKPVVADLPVQPRDTPTDLPSSTSDVMNDVTADLPAWGDPNGVKEGGVSQGGDPDFGVPFSNGVGGPPAGSGTGDPEPEVKNDEPIVVGGAVKKPEILVKTQPRYTELGRRAKVQGSVLLKAVIDEHGNVTDLQVLKPLPMGLDQAAMDAVSKWRFKPATLHGRPVKVYFNLTVNFTLQ